MVDDPRTCGRSRPFHADYADNDPLNKQDPTGERSTDADFGPDQLDSEPASCFVSNENLLPAAEGDVAVPVFCGDDPSVDPNDLPSSTTTTTTGETYQQLVDRFAAAATSRRNVGKIQTTCNPKLCRNQGLYGPPSTQWAGSGTTDVWVDVNRILKCDRDKGKYCGMDRLHLLVLHEIAHGATVHIFGNLQYQGTLVAGLTDLKSREEAFKFLEPLGVTSTMTADQTDQVWEHLSDCIAIKWGGPAANTQYGCPSGWGTFVDKALA